MFQELVRVNVVSPTERGETRGKPQRCNGLYSFLVRIGFPEGFFFFFWVRVPGRFGRRLGWAAAKGKGDQRPGGFCPRRPRSPAWLAVQIDGKRGCRIEWHMVLEKAHIIIKTKNT